MAFLTKAANRGSIATGYEIDNSLKFETANNEWLIRNSPTAGNRKTHTFSFWVKRTALGTINASGSQGIIGQGQHGRMFFGSDYFQYRFDDGHDVRDITTKFRDTAAWYHIVVAVDTNQSTSSNRVKIYYNGVQTTTIDHDGGSYPDIQDSASGWFNTNNITIGTLPFGASYTAGDGDYDMSGYLADFAAVDGTQYAPTDFGEFDEDTGIWKPKDLSDITWGSEGYYLKFDDFSNLGADSSGNGNNFTLSNITSADQATDTPTNNFCTLNPLWTGNTAYVGLIQEGATILRYSSGTKPFAKATMGVTNGKWYWEAMPHGTIGSQYLGIATGYNFTSSTALSQNYNMAINTTGGYYSYSDSLSETGGAFTTLTTSDVIGVALNLEDEEIKYYKNDSLILTRPLIANMQGETIFPYIMNYENRSFNLNFGGYTINTISSAETDENGYGTFEYAPPSGYYALCTKNLAEYG